MAGQVELMLDIPARVAASLALGETDIALMPVAAIPEIENARIISDYCIATENEVASVCLFSDVPVNEIECIFLDYQSRTSVALLKILLKHHWKVSPSFSSSSPGYETFISGKQAGLVIGDRALVKRKRSAYIYDLGAVWKEMTGLPFVFAVWVSTMDFSKKFILRFNEATSAGLSHLHEIIKANPFPDYDLLHYYRKNISYKLDKHKKEGMNRFLELLADQ